MAYKARLEKPEAGNPYYNTKANGGYSDAIKGKPTDNGCDVLSNCVGYAYGRFNEIGGYGYCKYLRPVNAENFMQYAGSLQIGQTPKLGAVAVWRKGDTFSGSDGAGHVAIVEEIYSPTSIKTSDSGYGSSIPFWTKIRNKGTDGRWGAGSDYTFLGFIYNPAVEDENEQAPAPVFPTYTAGKDNEHTIFNFLTEIMGLNTAAACGVLANIEHESSFNPTVYGDSGTSYGICQWHNTRFTALKNYCGQIGKEYTTLDGQLWYLKNELESGYKSVLAGIKSVPNTAGGAYEAGYIWCVKFEIPANKEQRGVTRGNTAKEYFAKYTNATTPETPVTPEKPTAPVADLLEVGQIVNFEGTIHYISSNAKKGVKCKPGKAKVTSRNKGAAHPVHLVKVSGGGSTVYGWVDLADITVVHTPAATIGKGSKVKIKEGSVYGGLSRTRGKAVPGWVCKRTLTIVDIAEHHGVKEARLQEINSWVAVASLTLA